MKLIAYLRVSSVGQLDGFGVDVQRKACRAWAKANGHRVVAEQVDSITGAMDALDRPGLSEALQAVRDGKGEGLLVAKLDRLARALTVQEATLAYAWKLGAAVFTADAGEVLQDDPSDPMRTAMRQMVGVFAELDRRMVVKRLRDGREAKQAAGGHSVGVHPYGSLAGEQATLSRMMELRGLGASYRAIAKSLDSEGLRPRRASSWSAMSIRTIVERRGSQQVSVFSGGLGK